MIDTGLAVYGGVSVARAYKAFDAPAIWAAGVIVAAAWTVLEAASAGYGYVVVSDCADAREERDRLIELEEHRRNPDRPPPPPQPPLAGTQFEP
ncbi:MAG TPA: hypothetical protein VJV78_08900 [Polyangiales bacterium]|nr:hypothetical protein [Polyangiales bacterium]